MGRWIREGIRELRFTIYDLRITNLRRVFRSVNRRVFRGLMGERIMQILRIVTDFVTI